MARLKPWYQVVTPREDLRENRPLDASEFAVHLDHIRLGRAHPDYIEPKRFFDCTFFTPLASQLPCQFTPRCFAGLRCRRQTQTRVHCSGRRCHPPDASQRSRPDFDGRTPQLC